MRSSATFFMLSLLGACTTAPIEDQDSTVPDVPAVEASVAWAGYYDGTLPCADCPGIETTLWIHSDGYYVLQEKYLDRDTWRTGHIGTWRVVEGGVELAHARDGGPLRLALVGDDLRLADAGGKPMPGDQPYTIEKLADEIFDEVPRMYVRGIHRIEGESHSFEPCGSGRIYPLAVGEHLDALMKARKQSGVSADAPLTMRILATMSYAEAMEGEEDDLYIWLREAPQLLKDQRCP